MFVFSVFLPLGLTVLNEESTCGFNVILLFQGYFSGLLFFLLAGETLFDLERLPLALTLIPDPLFTGSGLYCSN